MNRYLQILGRIINKQYSLNWFVGFVTCQRPIYLLNVSHNHSAFFLSNRLQRRRVGADNLAEMVLQVNLAEEKFNSLLATVRENKHCHLELSQVIEKKSQVSKARVPAKICEDLFVEQLRI